MTEKEPWRLQAEKDVELARVFASNGNKDAELYLEHLGCAARIVDNLIDKDVEVTNEQIVNMTRSMLVYIPCNKFFLENVQTLLPFHVSMLQAYVDSNELEKGTELEKNFANYLSDAINEIFHTVCWLTGGFKSLHEKSLELRKLLMNKQEN